MHAEPDEYEEAWKDLRRRRAVLFCMLPGVLLVVVVDRLEISFIGAVFLFIYIAALAITGALVTAFRCPRCRELFTRLWWCSNPFCGLRIDERPEPGTSPPGAM